jgi:ABC-type antimicrobial peptide transport system, ATPase component
MNIVEVKNLKKYYGKNDTLVKALDNVELTIIKGAFVAIVGTSGSGKSTLLNMLGGLDNQTSGTIKIGNVDLSTLSDDKLTIFRRRKIGFVFQNFNLVPTLNVYENIVLPLQLDGAKIDETYLNEILSLLHLENKTNTLPNALSGGQQQRVALARALITKPAIILADEPTGNLDSKTSFEVIGLLKESAKRYAQTIVMITHNDELAQMADYIIRIEDGKITNNTNSALKGACDYE